MKMKALIDRIDQRLEALGLSATEASKRATGSADTIRNWRRAAEQGKVAGASMRTLAAVARVLHTSVTWLTEGEGAEDLEGLDEIGGPVPISSRRVRYGGIVRAGGFFPVSAYFQQDDGDESVPPTVPFHPYFPEVSQYAWLVQGDSMDLAGIHDGMWVLAASYLEYIDKIGDVENDQIVIVERSRYGGEEIERTLKEVQFTRDGMRLVPRSSNATYQELFVPRNHGADSDIETVTIIAVVLSAVRDFSQRRKPAAS